MKKNRIIFSVPADLAYTAAVEDFVDIITKQYKTENHPELNQQLRSILNEAFVNVIRHGGSDKNDLVKITFVIDTRELLIQVPDPGRGLELAGMLPPYPEHVHHTQHSLLQTIDGEVLASIDDACSVTLAFRPKNIESVTSPELVNQASDGGMGLSMIVKLMDCVRFVYSEEQGNCLQITKNLAGQ